MVAPGRAHRRKLSGADGRKCRAHLQGTNRERKMQSKIAAETLSTGAEEKLRTEFWMKEKQIAFIALPGKGSHRRLTP